MAKIPAKPEDVFDAFINDYKNAYHADLLGIMLYGSGARGEYIPRKSDINFMIILSENGIEHLGKALPLVSSWHKRRVSTPLFLTKTYIESSLDVFPIEFLNFKAAYRLVYGEDVLKDVVIDKKFLRLQCERELKGKLLQLRENFLETEGNRRRISGLVGVSLPTFLSIFQAVLFLKGQEPVVGTEALGEAVARETGLAADIFAELIAVKSGRKKIAAAEAVPLMERYIQEVRRLALWVDKLEMS